MTQIKTNTTEQNRAKFKRYALYALGLFFAYFAIILWIGWGGKGFDFARTGTFGDSFGVLNAMFSGLGLVGLLVTLRFQQMEYKETMASLQKTVFGSVNDRLYAHNLEYVKCLLDTPELLPMFNDDKIIEKSHKEYQRAFLIAEVLAGYLEIVVLHYDEIPDIKPYWHAYIKDAIKQSPILREYLTKHGTWYVPQLQKYMDEYTNSTGRSSPTNCSSQE